MLSLSATAPRTGVAVHRLDPHQEHLFLFFVAPASIASRASPAWRRSCRRLRSTASPSLKPRSAAALFGSSTSVAAGAVLAGAAALLGQRGVRPSFGTSGPWSRCPSSCRRRPWLRPSRRLGEHQVDDLVLALVGHVQLAASPGASAPMVRASFTDNCWTVSPSPEHDHVAGLDASLCRESIALQFPRPRAFGLSRARLSAIFGRRRWIWTPIQPRLTALRLEAAPITF